MELAREQSAAAPEDGARVLVLVAPTEYDASVAKGNSELLHDFDERGFFSRVVMVFPFTRHNRVLELAPNLHIHEFAVSGPGGPLASPLLRQALGPLHIWRMIGAVARLIRNENAAVVRATDPCLAGLIAHAAARRTGRKVAVSIHADFDKRHELDKATGAPRILGSRGLANAVERYVLRRADLVMPIRDTLVPYAERRGATADRIHVIPHGADLTAFTTPSAIDVRAALGLSPGKQIVSFVGRLVKENYIDDVITLGRELAERRDTVELVVAGGGLEEERIRQEVAGDARLSTVVRLVGPQPRTVVAALRQASAVAVSPMGGFSIIEACAAGVPVVAYDVEWHGELVIEGETGYLVPERDVARMADAVRRLLDDPAAARRMGAKARERALARHDLEVAAEHKRKGYRLLVQQQGGQHP